MPPRGKSEPKIVWNKGYVPESKNLAEYLKENPEPPQAGQDALPPPVAYTDDDGVVCIVPAE